MVYDMHIYLQYFERQTVYKTLHLQFHFRYATKDVSRTKQ